MVTRDIIRFLRDSKLSFVAEGAEDQAVLGYSSIFQYKAETVTWLRDTATITDRDYRMPDSFACIITDEKAEHIANAACQIRVDNPKDVFFDILNHFWAEPQRIEISPKAEIEKGAEIGSGVSIGPFTHISAEVKIGDHCIIGSHVTIKGKVTLGKGCVIQSGAVLGEDGFGFVKQGNTQKFIKHYGGVTLEDYVQIGANSCVCRGAIDDTHLGEHTKIDNLCHIAHNVRIGKNCLVIAGTVIMGSVSIGDDCWISTSVIRDLRSVGDNSLIGLGSVVVRDVHGGLVVSGNPARERKTTFDK